MDRPTYNALRERLHNDAMDEHLAKSKDYATEDVLSNFKIIADLLQVDPLLVWAVYDTKHNLAILRYCRDRKLDSEAIRGRLIDRLNYTDLLEGLINDPVTYYTFTSPPPSDSVQVWNFDAQPPETPESGEDEEDEEDEMLNIAYADGWRGGYDKGVEDGYDHGHRQGLEDGAATEPRSERDQRLVDAAYRQGRAEGYAEGYMNGKDERNAT